jgi:Protein of unknown function (DUF642)
MRRSVIGLFMLVGLSLALVSSPAVAQTNLVQNGSFEVGYESTTQIDGGWPNNHGFWAPIGYFGATDTIPNWTVSGGGVDWQDADSSVPDSMVAADGERFIDLNSCCGNAPGTVSQAIPTTPGVSYTMSFSYSANPYSPCYFGPKTMQASAGSASTVVSADPLAEGYLDGTNIWHAASLSFTAASASTVISFASLENDGTCAGPMVDNVSVMAQPATCPCSTIDQFNSILANLNYCVNLGGAVITSIDPPVMYDPTIFSLAAGGNTPGAGDQCGVLQNGVPLSVLTVTTDQAALCTQLVFDAAESRGVACTAP